MKARDLGIERGKSGAEAKDFGHELGGEGGGDFCDVAVGEDFDDVGADEVDAIK